MDDDAMGLDTFVQQEGTHRSVTLDDADGNEKRIKLEKAMVRQRAIVCRGTTCYETSDSHVAKFSWASGKRKLEVEQMRRAERRGVRGVARVVAHRQVTTIAAIRKGCLEFLKPHRFRDETIHLEDTESVTASTNSSSYKRKSSSDHTSDNASETKRRRSNSQKSKLGTELHDRWSIKVRPSLYAAGEDL
jgi:hypothetical protein